MVSAHKPLTKDQRLPVDTMTWGNGCSGTYNIYCIYIDIFIFPEPITQNSINCNNVFCCRIVFRMKSDYVPYCTSYHLFFRLKRSNPALHNGIVIGLWEAIERKSSNPTQPEKAGRDPVALSFQSSILHTQASKLTSLSFYTGVFGQS